MPFKFGVLEVRPVFFETGFYPFRGGLGATIVKPDFGELAQTSRGGLIDPVLTLLA